MTLFEDNEEFVLFSLHITTSFLPRIGTYTNAQMYNLHEVHEFMEVHVNCNWSNLCTIV